MGIALLVIGLLALAGGITLLVIPLHGFVKSIAKNLFDKKDWIFIGSGFLSLLLSGGLLAGAMMNLGAWAIKGGDAAMAIIGLALFFFCFPLLWCAFYLRYWKTDMQSNLMKWVRLTIYVTIPLSLCVFLLFTEGIAPYLSYPLVSGFVIDGEGFRWAHAGETFSGGLHVAWYGVIMICGALISYFVSDHQFYKKYHKHGLLDGTLIVGFLSGVIGARVWYVVGNWHGDGAGGPNFSELCAQGRWYEMFYIWEGGLTIIGGAVAGIICGALFLYFTKKEVDIRWAIDTVVPTILLAQALGRWGNYFNCEVYGAATSMDAWSFLPSIILNQMHITNSGYPMAEGMMHVPLFLIESLVNICGYFIIAYGVPAIWRKYRPAGSLCGCYLIWYGIVRMIMEPLRDPSFNMGADGQWSFWNSLGYLIIGLGVIGAFALYDFIKAKRTSKEAK